MPVLARGAVALMLSTVAMAQTETPDVIVGTTVHMTRTGTQTTRINWVKPGLGTHQADILGYKLQVGRISPPSLLTTYCGVGARSRARVSLAVVTYIRAGMAIRCKKYVRLPRR
jgi:hypothetical protein